MSVKLFLHAAAVLCALFAPLILCADVWIAGHDQLVRVSTSGQILATADSVFGRGFNYVGQDIIGVDQRNGNVWVSDANNNRVFEVNAAGEPLREVTFLNPVGIGIDPTSGGVWTSISLGVVPPQRAIIQLAPSTGQEIVRVTGFASLVSGIAVAPSGQVWIADQNNNEVVVLFGTNAELNGYDASEPSGPHHLRFGGFNEPFNIDIDPGTDALGGESAWIANRNHPNGEAVKITSNGTELVRVNPTGFFEVRFVSASLRDGSVWIGDPNSGRIAKLSALGQEVQNLSIVPMTLAVDVTDDSLWVATTIAEEIRVHKLDSDGSELFSVGPFDDGIVGIAAFVALCDNLVISNYKTQPGGSQFVEVANVGDLPTDTSSCSLVTFNVYTQRSIGAAARALWGMLDPGASTKIRFTGQLPTGPGAMGIYKGPPPANGTRFSTTNEVTGMVYLSNTVVYGISHLTVPAQNSIYSCIYGGSGTGPFMGPFPKGANCF